MINFSTSLRLKVKWFGKIFKQFVKILKHFASIDKQFDDADNKQSIN